MPENRLESGFSAVRAHKRTPLQAILRRGFVRFMGIVALCSAVIVKQPSSDNTPYEKIGDELRPLADEVPFDIPDSWEWVRLGNISSYAETKQKVNATSTDPSIWGLDLEDIEKGGRLLEHKTVGERRAVGDKTVFAKGDILYSKLRPYLLKILVAPDDGICTPEIVPFRVYGGINPNYIVNYLK